MPSSSKKQHNFMAAIAHSPSFAKKVGVPQSVGKDFNDADKGKKMKANPMNPKNPPSAAKAIKIPKSSGNRADLQKVNRPKTNQGSAELFKKGGDTMATKMNPGFMAMMAKKKDGAKSAMPAALAKHAAKPASKAHAGLKAGGMAYAKGGGIESKGKTKGKMIKMNSGGRAC